jgi:hypothetical protein
MVLSASETAFLDTVVKLVDLQEGRPTPTQRGHLRALQQHADGDQAATISRLLSPAEPVKLVPLESISTAQQREEQAKAFDRGASRANQPAYSAPITQESQ